MVALTRRTPGSRAPEYSGDKGFDDFLVSLMRAELENRQESNRKRKIRAARFPYAKTLEEFDFSYLEHVSEATDPAAGQL